MKLAKDYEGNLAELIKDFKFQPSLTATLDAIGDKRFDQTLINEIVLWKVNRYAPLDTDLIVELNGVCALLQGNHREAKSLISKLLKQAGVDLAMASTLLRFRNPKVFQIIDRHAYRALYGTNYPLFPASSESRKIEIYFKYLDDLKLLSEEKNVDFCVIDRLLYVFDKKKNGKL
jgi:thermostable 8-oxoguanine DNA glycosylase